MPYADPAKRREYILNYHKERRADRKAKGLCVSCGADAQGKAECPDCLEMNSIRVQRAYRKLHGKGGETK